jgi:hypothetical protein
MQLHLNNDKNDYEIVNRRTLDTHKWFINEFNKAEQKQDKINKYKADFYALKKFQYLVLLVFVYSALPKLNIYGNLMFIIVMFVLLYLYDRDTWEEIWKNTPTPLNKPIVYMRFFCPDIFYRNRHYIFSGTKIHLQKAFQLERDNIDFDKSDPHFGRGDHDNLLDMPLDTFCNAFCECLIRTEQHSNYNCSHWSLHSFNSQEEMQQDIRELELLNRSPEYTGFKNEIIYI